MPRRTTQPRSLFGSTDRYAARALARSPRHLAAHSVETPAERHPSTVPERTSTYPHRSPKPDTNPDPPDPREALRSEHSPAALPRHPIGHVHRPASLEPHAQHHTPPAEPSTPNPHLCPSA